MGKAEPSPDPIRAFLRAIIPRRPPRCPPQPQPDSSRAPLSALPLLPAASARGLPGLPSARSLPPVPPQLGSRPPPPVPSLPGRYFWPGSARPGPPPPPAGPAPFPPRWRSAEAAGEEVTGEGGGAVYGVCLWDWGARPAPIPLPVLRDPPCSCPHNPPGRRQRRPGTPPLLRRAGAAGTPPSFTQGPAGIYKPRRRC